MLCEKRWLLQAVMNEFLDCGIILKGAKICLAGIYVHNGPVMSTFWHI